MYDIQLKEQRIKAGLTLRQLAEATGISKSALHEIENKLVDPHVSSIVVLAKFFHCNLSDLIKF